uniref:Reverse transcriptase zinc-binding domain-containing protein n=1 Tax=Ananas comosus var. bracteatus TaxID=296719 RepID=A0A6V7PVX5_ANACO|nr:unnamed protein product [Ananas comosus var. bracteatus]
MNTALLVKWWWRFHTAPHLSWIKIIRALYYRRRRPLWEGRGFRPSSYWWKGVLTTKDIFKLGTNYFLGNGRSVDFWLDRWCGDTTLQASFPEVFTQLDRKPILVRDCFGSDEWNWDRILGDETSVPPSLCPILSELKERVTSFSIGQTEDRIGWRWESNDIFSVQSAYRMLNDEGTRDVRGSLIWRFRIPLKIKVFCWLVLKKRTLTAVNLSKTGWTRSTACVLCRTSDESVDHLFTQCVFIKYIMVAGLEEVQSGELVDPVSVVRRLKQLIGSWNDLL